jgi:hypothetical protein
LFNFESTASPKLLPPIAPIKPPTSVLDAIATGYPTGPSHQSTLALTFAPVAAPAKKPPQLPAVPNFDMIRFLLSSFISLFNYYNQLNIMKIS